MIIADLNGRAIEVNNSLRAGQTLKVGSNYSVGVYFARFIQGDKIKIVKLIKQ